MKNQVFFLTLLIAASCTKKHKNELSNENPSIIMDTVTNNNIDKNMKVQLKEYLQAFNRGDADKALSYFYPDIFEYARRQYPNDEFDIETFKDTAFIRPVTLMKELVKEKDIRYEMEVGEITKKVDYENNKLYVVSTSMTTIIGKDRNTISGEVVAVSNDNGKTWKFVQNDPSIIRGILKIKFPTKIVNQLLTKD